MQTIIHRNWQVSLQSLVVVDHLQVGVLLLDSLLHIRLQLIDPDRGPLAVQRTAERRGKGQAKATEERLNGGVCPRESLEDALLLEDRGKDRREQHSRDSHSDATQHHSGDSMRGGRLRDAHLLVVLVEQLHTLLEFPVN